MFGQVATGATAVLQDTSRSVAQSAWFWTAQLVAADSRAFIKLREPTNEAADVLRVQSSFSKLKEAYPSSPSP